MNRLIIVGAVASAAFAVAVPAVAGLAGNPSFSHRLPVRAPSQAQLVQFDDRGHVIGVAATTMTPPRTPGDDHGGLRTSHTPEPGDDRGGDRTTSAPSRGETEPGDDRGGDATTATSSRGPGGGSDDSRGGSPVTTPSTEPTDDRGRDTSTSPTSGDDVTPHDVGDDNGTDPGSGGRHGG